MRTKQKISSEIVIDKNAPMGQNKKLHVVVEAKHYLLRAEKILSADEMVAVIDVLAANPLKGDVIKGGGGLRKLRFAYGSRGKSGGARIIYYYYDGTVPVLVLDIYSKNGKENLSKAERNSMATFIADLKKEIKK